MDDVWKDLSLSSHNHDSTTSISAAQPPISDLDFQDLLSCPLNQIHQSKSDEQKSYSSTVSKPQIKNSRSASGPCVDENARDRKMIRLMKNRESAARSRARKQAYTYELELEVAHLLKENARLRQQQEKVCVAAGDRRPKNHRLCSLYRTLTAPF
ncbi:protein FD-like [Primulina eburnea]|uniref:protein FD-like n=1 Tax=Primulina eburnea TaxID=1245227 RepID=UPI003C6C5A7C